MDIKILLLICYNAVSISESYHPPPESLEQRDRRSSSYDYIGNVNPDQCFCFSSRSVSSSLEERLDPQNTGLRRLVVYLYLNELSDQSYLYIPNHAKQLVFPSLNFEQDDVIQLLPDRGILENNINISILINNKSAQPWISDTSDITDLKWSKDFGRPINKLPLIEIPINYKNPQSSHILKGFNALTNEPNVFQTPDPNSPSNTNNYILRSVWEDKKSERPAKSPSEYYDYEYESPLFQETIRSEKPPVPPGIGFNQVKKVISEHPESTLNLSHIVPDRNNIVHFTRNNQAKKSISQPYGFLLLNNSVKDAVHNKVPVNLNLVNVPTSHSTNALTKGAILPPILIKQPPNHSHSYISPNDLEVEPNLIRFPPKHSHSYISPNTLEAEPNMIRVPPNHSRSITSPNNLEVQPNIIRVPPNHSHSYISPNKLEAEPNTIRVPPNHSYSYISAKNLEAEPNMIRVHPNHSHSYINPDNSHDGTMIKNESERHANNINVNSYMIKMPRNLFSVWYYNQIATANQGMDIQINNDKLKRDIITTLARYNMYISEDGNLIDAQETIITWDYVQLRPILVGEPMEYETVINSPDPLHLEPGNTFWKALLVTFGPSSATAILDIIPLGKMQLHEKSGVNVNVTIDSHICKSGDCKVIVPVRVGDQATLTRLQNYMQLRAQHFNIAPGQLLNRKNLGLKLNRLKEPALLMSDKYGKSNWLNRKETFTKSGRREKDAVLRKPAMKFRKSGREKKVPKSDRREKDLIDMEGDRITTAAPGTSKTTTAPDSDNDWRIIGGAAATSSGAPLNVRGRSGYIF